MGKSNKFIFAVMVVAVSMVLLVCVIISVRNNTPGINMGEDEANAIAVKFIDVPVICQYPELPTGCESVAATMVLQYYNEEITTQRFAREWLECSEDFYTYQGKEYGPDPNEVFAGNPFSRNSYGCFSMPIVNAINQNSRTCEAKVITGRTLDELCAEYIDNDKPLLIWVTMNMKESYEGNSWYLEDGSFFTWIAQEHCLVLVGYNEEFYFVNDPMSGSVVAYQKNIVEKRFAELSNQAVYIHPNNM